MAETHLEQIKKARPQILTGEIGALLHDIGKCHPDFVKKQSLEGGKDFGHSKINGFLKPELTSLLKHGKFSFNINSENSHIYSLITEHHPPNDRRDTVSDLVKLLMNCDRLDSADDKGIVRKKQSIDNTVISTPFGFAKEKITPVCLDARLNELQERLIEILQGYLSNKISLEQLREFVMDKMYNLYIAFSHALGETRVPANDVTLWAHSYSTASLYKAVLCGIVWGEKPKPQDLKWRIFGISWDGLGFMGKGKKVADILKRKQIIEEIKEELKTKFEVVYPLGNAVYEDINGIFFTFPALEEEKAKEIAGECAKIGLDIISEKSSRELWPFFTLSDASRSLTILGQELKFAAEKRNIPRMSPILFIGGKEELLDIDWRKLLPEGEGNREGYDICPVCQIRSKDPQKEICEICDERRRGRLDQWLDREKEKTIWIDEVADENNRVALLTMGLGLDKWLDGTLVGTIYSQTFEDWLSSKTEKNTANEFLGKVIEELVKNTKEEIDKKIKEIENIKKNITKNVKDDVRKEKLIKEKEKEQEILNEQLKRKLQDLEVSLQPTQTTALRFIKKFLELKDVNKDVAAKIFGTFFNPEDLKISKSNIEIIWKNLKLKLPDEKPETVLSALFTQNPSPARLFRIWQEVEDFWAEVLQRLFEPEGKWQRIQFNVDIAKLKAEGKLRKEKQVAEKTPYILKFKNLEPDTLLVLHIENGKFFTIESLDNFKFKNEGVQGAAAVEKALKEKGFYHLALEEEPGESLLNLDSDKDETVIAQIKGTEKYYPFIEVIRTPLLFQIIVPALDAVKILNMIDVLFNERFEKVTGKLPLNAGLLVVNRKFPLYLLLDAGRRVLRDRGLKEQVFLDPWWDISRGRNDKFYGFYPLKKLEQSKPGEEKDNNYTLDELALLSNGKPYALYPGYFDFELLRGNEDRCKLAYGEKKRAHRDYKLFSARPCYFYQFKQMVDLWEIITNNLSTSQINFIEQAITLKIGEWKDVEDPGKKEVLQAYMEAVLRDAFGETWPKLPEETRCFILNSAKNNLLLDTIVLFRHVIKEKGGK